MRKRVGQTERGRGMNEWGKGERKKEREREK